MTDHLKTLREALEIGYDAAKERAQEFHEAMKGYRPERHIAIDEDVDRIKEALAAIDALEAAMREPIFWYRPVGEDGLYEGPVHNNSVGGKMLRDEKPSEWVPLYRAAPPAQQARECGVCGSDKAFSGPCGGGRNNPKALCYETPEQQAQRPDFHDEWAGYLKDGETPFERFLRERKDLNALTKLYQRVLEENERLKAQQPRQCGLCGSDEAFTGTCGGGRRDPRALCYEPVAQQPQAKRTWLTDPRQTKERQFAEFLNDRRNMNVSAVFHDLMGKFAALTAPQQAEAVPPGYVLVPIEPTKKMVDAGGFVKIEVTYTYAGYVDVHIGDDAARNAYRAMIAAAQGEKP